MQKLDRLVIAGLAGITALLFCGATFAQSGASAVPAQPARANEFPISGRASQVGSVTATQTPVAGTTTSINTINPTVQVQGDYTGSATGGHPFSGNLSFHEAVQRALEYNLGLTSSLQGVNQIRGVTKVARSALLPNLNGYLNETVQQTDLQALGLRFRIPIPGVSIPTVVGPYNYFDLRATLSQTIADVTAWKNYRSAQQTLRANQLSACDARDLVVLAAGGAYLQVIAARARVKSETAQLETAQALYDQTFQRRGVGLVAQIDVNRSRIQLLTERQRLLSLQDDFAKQKINLARIAGLPSSDHYELTDDVPFEPAPVSTVDDAVRRAFGQRSDLKAAQSQLRAAEMALSAARAERLPSLALTADYGAIGVNPNQSHGTFSVTGSLRFPIWQGGRIEGDIEQADAVFAQRQSELADTRAQVEADVRKAFLDLEAAAGQVQVAQENVQVAQENLKLTRQRLEEGVADNVQVVQSQELVATAQLDLINAIFAHNIAKLSLARAMGEAASNLGPFLKIVPGATLP